MSKITDALKRKIGPFPAWVWAGIVGGGLWWYRNHTSAGGSQTQGQGLTSGYYGPYGEDAYPIQGGGGIAGGGDTGGVNGNGAAGADTGTNVPTSGPPSITVNPPDNTPAPGSGGRKRTRKGKPGHTRQTHGRAQKGKTRTRSAATTHNGSARNRVRTVGASLHITRARTGPAVTHPTGKHTHKPSPAAARPAPRPAPQPQRSAPVARPAPAPARSAPARSAPRPAPRPAPSRSAGRKR